MTDLRTELLVILNKVLRMLPLEFDITRGDHEDDAEKATQEALTAILKIIEERYVEKEEMERALKLAEKFIPEGKE